MVHFICADETDGSVHPLFPKISGAGGLQDLQRRVYIRFQGAALLIR